MDLSRFLDLGPSATFIALPTPNSGPGVGTAWTLGGGLRLKRPHDAPDGDSFFAISPWVDVDALYVRTGNLDRFGLAGAVGLSMPVGRSQTFWLGPFVRYLHIFQPNATGFDDHDAKILSVGLSLEVGAGVQRARETLVPPLQTAPPASLGPRCTEPLQATEPVACPACADLCPKVVVQSHRLELKQRIYFAPNEAAIHGASFPMLNQVVQTLKDNARAKVEVEGNASSEGGEKRNRALSNQRAQAVLDYLVAHGIDRNRLASKGFSSSAPAESNATEAGREANRRVEFIVAFVIVNDGSK